MSLDGKLHPSVLGSVPDDIEKLGVLTATSILQQRANEVRNQRVNWQSYFQPFRSSVGQLCMQTTLAVAPVSQPSQMISQEDYVFIVALDNSKTGDEKESLLKEQRHQCARSFLNLLGHISKDQTIQYLLVMIDDMLMEDKSRVEIFKDYCRKKKENVWSCFLNLLNRPDEFIMNLTARIIAKMACWSKDRLDGSDLHFYLTWLKDQLRSPRNEYLGSIGRCLQMMLRIDEYRIAFTHLDGISTIVSVLAERDRHNFQIQYQLTFCLWVLSFNPTLAAKMTKHSVIPCLSDILSESAKEKVTRIILAVFRNLIEKPEETATSRENCIAMVQCKVLKQLSILEQRRLDDEDLVSDIDFLNEKLQESIQDLSSFDEYSTELKSGRLDWSPVHRSERFWRENAGRLNEKNYELLKILVKILETSIDPLVLSVANHDIGEYVRHYPRGKRVIEQIGGKQLVMQYLAHDDPNVRYEALLAVQKLMVHNWEYLGKQLEKDVKKSDQSAAS